MGNTFDAPDPIDEDCKSGIGPRGKGDPDDFTLRARELKVHIPKFQEAAALKVHCKDLAQELQHCMDNNFALLASCYHLNTKLKACTELWTNDLEYREQMIEEYLLVRQEFRKTGRNRLYRALKGETYVTESERKGYQV
ncbi:uncharacterized protein LOC113206377 isoform X2 [Frankliniella occidentalis]|uniref:COX assembly mitochondrial protein n=1 Tax=Frankliniella occidentalis TaxID=133901 RepID=A0A6J1SC08_FRAOC|nr:uncharacterized protein LOC113206377 isoform X2 [Frankliniella occidentalis]